ncbi:MAG: sugar kinase [Acuticoccus sp.]
MIDILSFGEPLIEFNNRGGTAFVKGFGGDTSNVAIAAARQGATTGMIAHIGTDAFGDDLMGLWANEGVSTATVRRDPDAPTGIYFVDHGPDGHTFSYRRAGSAASRVTPDELPLEAIRAARTLHVSGISLAISDSACDASFAAMREAREAGVTVSFDLNLRKQLWPIDRARALIHAALAHTDIALPGLDDASALTGLDDPREIIALYRSFGPRIVALTLGEGGALVADGEAIHEIPPRPADLVDASGAGDCFDGSFLARLIAGDDTRAAAEYATVAASLSVEGVSAIAPIPRKDAVEAALAAWRS